jgi:hypothetical protein
MELGLPNIQILELYSTWGDVNVFTTFDEGIFCVRAPINSEKVFYLWDLDWHCTGLDFSTCKSIIDRSDRFYCRCEAHQKVIENYFGRKPEIMETFDMKELYGSKCGST